MEDKSKQYVSINPDQLSRLIFAHTDNQSKTLSLTAFQQGIRGFIVENLPKDKSFDTVTFEYNVNNID